MAKDSELKSEYDEVYKDADCGWRNFLTEARTDTEMFLNAQNSEKEEKAARLLGRALYVINKLGRQIDLLEGYEIRNRHILKYSPVGIEDNEVARQHTAMTRQQLSNFGGYDVMSDCFKWGQLVQGSNLMEIWKDRDGFLRFSRLGYNQFLMDPTFVKDDLSDLPYYLTGRWLSDATVKSMAPEKAGKIDKIPMGHSARRWDFASNHTNGIRSKLRLYEEYWRRKTTFVPTVISRLTAEQIPMKELVDRYQGDKRRVEYLIENAKLPDGSPALSKFDKPKHTIKLTTFVDGEVIFDDTNPLAMDDYNVVWFHGDWAPEVDRDELKLQPFIRRNRDPQLARNRKFNQAIDIIDSQLNAYRKVREGALKNIEDAWDSGQGKVMVVKKDFDGTLDDAFRQENAPSIDAGLFQLLQVLDKDTTEVGGMNEEIFGSDTKDIPAVLSRQRTGAALTGHAGIFQRFRRAKRQLGHKILRLNQIWQDPIRVQRMINEMPTEGFYDEEVLQYDCTPTEGVLTESQQEQNYLELKELRSLYPDAAAVITFSDIIEAAPIQARRQLLERIKQREQQQADAAKQGQQDQERMNRLVEAETAAKVARANEDTSDIIENRANTKLLNAKTETELLNLQNEQIMDMAERMAKVNLMQAQAEAARRGPEKQAPSRRRKGRNK
jgi:hypothetical protein